MSVINQNVTYTEDIDLQFGIPYEDVDKAEYSRDYLESLDEASLTQLYKWQNPVERAKLQREDPVTYGWTLERWRRIMDKWDDATNHIVYGGNRSGKSTFASRVVLFYAENIPEAEIRCFSVNSQSSINDQQKMVWDALPEKYKNMSKTKGKNFSVQYSQKNGFSGDKLILPPKPGYEKGSTIYFQNYRSFQLDSQVAEGWKANLIWADEEIPMNLFETLQLRITDFLEHKPLKSKIILTFTTLQGYTALINDLNSGARTTKYRYSDLVEENLPYEQVSKNRADTRLWYFWSADNVFIPRSAIAKFKTRPRDEILARAHGICVKSITTKFPKFSRDIHVIPHSELPWLKEPGRRVTHYQALDPAGTKHWFWIYAGVVEGLDDTKPEIYVWAEFPDISYGEWGLQSESPKGKPGPAMPNTGKGLLTYSALMDEMEGSDAVFERLVDKRFAKHTNTGLHGDTRLLEELLQVGKRFIPPVLHKADVSGQGKTEIDLGIQEINNYLDYEATLPVDAVNRPRLYISDRCENLIQCVEFYTAEGGTDEVWKDGVDCIRILLDGEPRCVNWQIVPKRNVTAGY